MRIASVATLLVAASTMGCAFVSRAPLTGFVYQGTSANEQATSNDVGAKTGEACATSILGIVATGDASISTAAKNGGITKISHVDSTASNILGVYAEYCAVVHGN